MAGVLHGARCAGLALLAATAITTPAFADGNHAGHGAMPGASAAKHEPMMKDHHPQQAASGHGHDAASGHDHGAAPSDDHSGASAHDHGQTAPAAEERPVARVLGAFAVVNLLVLAYAAIARRRPAAVKRRQTLARVRSAAGARSPAS